MGAYTYTCRALDARNRQPLVAGFPLSATKLLVRVCVTAAVNIPLLINQANEVVSEIKVDDVRDRNAARLVSLIRPANQSVVAQ